MIKFILLIVFHGHWVRQKKIVSMTISVKKISVKTIFVKTISVKITFLRTNRDDEVLNACDGDRLERCGAVWYGIMRYETAWEGKVKCEWGNVERGRSCVWLGERGGCVRVCGDDDEEKEGEEGEGGKIWMCVCVVRIWEEGRKKWNERLTFTKNSIAYLMFWQSKWDNY